MYARMGPLGNVGVVDLGGGTGASRGAAAVGAGAAAGVGGKLRRELGTGVVATPFADAGGLKVLSAKATHIILMKRLTGQVQSDSMW